MKSKISYLLSLFYYLTAVVKELYFSNLIFEILSCKNFSISCMDLYAESSGITTCLSLRSEILNSFLLTRGSLGGIIATSFDVVHLQKENPCRRNGFSA